MPDPTILDRIAAALRGAGQDIASHSQEGINSFDEALSGVRVKPGAILTDAGYVMPDAQGNADFSQVGMERVPDVLRAATLFGDAMPWGKGVGMAAKAGTEGKAAAMAANAARDPYLTAAIRHDGKLYRAPDGSITHIEALDAMPPDIRGRAQFDANNRVFVTPNGKILNRERAQSYALENDLLSKDAPPYARTSPELISEFLAPNRELRERARGAATFTSDDDALLRELGVPPDLLASRANLGPLAAALAGDDQK